MELFSKKVSIGLFIFAVLVLLLAFFWPVHPKNDGIVEPVSKGQNEPPAGSISDHFNISSTPIPINAKNLPTGIQVDEACRLNGQIVKEGTVASNVICINETPEPTEIPEPTPST